MKKIKILLIILISSICLQAQFMNPGGSGEIPDLIKIIYGPPLYGPPMRDGHYSNPITAPIAAKLNLSDRRFKFRAHIYSNCSYTEDELNNTNGWNKIGRISFIKNSSANIFKMHLGWIFRDDPNTIELSLFYHNNDNEYFIAHKIDERSFPDVNASVDMYLGERVIGMIINNEYDPNYDIKCIGIRENNTSLASSQDSYVASTFYFGGESSVPHRMEMKFHDLYFDEPGYQTKFNSCDVMTWNLSEFNNGDNFSYTANKEIHASVADPHTVQYHSDHPNKEYQKCIIHSGANISFTAGDKVELHPGFHAEPGSTFSAEIDDAPIIIVAETNQFDEEIVYRTQNVSLFEVLIYLDSSRDSLVYSTQNYAQDGYARATIDSELSVKNYYVVSNFYSGLGSHKTVSHEAFNNGIGLKNKWVASSDDGNQYIFSIYPNPSSGKFEVRFAEGTNYEKFEILSINGQLILKDKLNNMNKLSINLSDQPKGIYLLRLIGSDHIDVHRLLIH